MKLALTMRTACLALLVLLCMSCTAKRQEGNGGQKDAAAEGLIQAGAGDEKSSSSGTTSSKTESIPAADVQPSSAGTNSDTEAASASAGVAGGTSPAASSVRGIGGFNWDAARIQPACYLPNRDSFLSMSYYESSVLYLVGFSPDGKMAFLKELFLEGKGGIDLYFVVQDLVSDEILWELKAPSDDDYEYAPGQGLHERFITDYESQIDGKLAEYGITVSPCSYERLPYTAADGRTFSVSIDEHDTGKLMYDMFSVTSYSCIVTDGRGRSKKVIADKEFMGPEAFACGCIKSPYEDRLAIVVAEASFGFEGSDILFCIAGCDMKKGF